MSKDFTDSKLYDALQLGYSCQIIPIMQHLQQERLESNNGDQQNQSAWQGLLLI
jgi:hypothetical protein